jgi:hypothetical protein
VSVPSGARTRTVVVTVSGDEALIDRSRPPVATCSAKVSHEGAWHGSAAFAPPASPRTNDA